MEEGVTRSHLLPTSTYQSYSRFHVFPCFTILGSFARALFPETHTLTGSSSMS